MMELRSPSFFIGGTIPYQYTCDGENVSPPVSWDNPPDGTVSFTLIVDDPDAPNGTFTHWIVYDIPVNHRHLPERLDHEPTLPGGGVQGKNDFGNIGFSGPCPPQDVTHRYFFKLFAVDQLLALPAGATRAEVLDALAGHVLEKVEMMGKYARQE